MVATLPGRRPTAPAALLSLLLLAPLIPLPSASAQPVDLHEIDLVLDTGIVRFNGAITPFVVGPGVMSVTVTIQNVGQGSAPVGIPVFFFIKDQPSVPGKCHRLTEPLPAGQSRTLPPYVISPAPSLPAGGYNVSVYANRAPPTDKPYQFDCSPSTVRPGSLEDPNNPEATDTVFFVKDRAVSYAVDGIRWCTGSPGAATGCNIVENDPGYAVTQESHIRTHFLVNVTNRGNWSDTTNYTSGKPFPFIVNASIAGANVVAPDERWLTTDVTGSFEADPAFPAGGVLRHRTGSFDLFHKTGVYNLTVTILPEWVGGSGWVARRNATVDYWDLGARINATNFRTTAAAPYSAGPLGDTIQGYVTFSHNGTAAPQEDVFWRIYLDSPSACSTNTVFCKSEKNATGTVPARISPTRPFEWTVPVSLFFNADPSNAGNVNYLSPGIHTLHAQIDYNGGIFESNETNNSVSIPIYIADATKPVFRQTMGLLYPRITECADGRCETADPTGGGYTDPPILSAYANETFLVTMNVTDDDPTSLFVSANFTNKEDPSITRNYTMELKETVADGNQVINRYIVKVRDFYAANDTTRSGNWTVRVYARDAFGNENFSHATPATAPLRIDRWPIQFAPMGEVLVNRTSIAGEPLPEYVHYDGEVINYSDVSTVRLRIKVTNPQTGVPFQYKDASNINYTLYTPRGTVYHDNRFTPQWGCQNEDQNPDDNGNGIIDLGEVTGGGTPNPACDPTNEASGANFFETSIDKTESRAGKYNLTIHVRDRAREVADLNLSFTLRDELPTFELDTKLDDLIVTPGQNLTLNLSVSDDFSISAAYANLTRGDGRYTNLTLDSSEVKPSDDGSRKFYWFNETFPYGRYKDVGVAGNYTATFVALDENGNWATSESFTVTLVDEKKPVILPNSGVDRPTQEARSNVTFWTHVSDETNVTAHVIILRGTEEILRAPMEEQPGGNFTATLNLSTEGAYLWQIVAFDSAGTPSDFLTGTLSIRDNLGPRVDVRSPVSVGGDRFGTARALVELLVYDADGVDPGTITLKANGNPVGTDAPEPALPDLNVNGYLVRYSFPVSAGLRHGDVVTINVTAADNSTRRLTGYHNFTFTVDDVAPVTRVVAVSSSHRAASGHTLNVSLDSTFSLAAEDADGQPTTVRNIHYRIIGGGNNNLETIYTTPFRVTDLAGVYTGPRVYQLQAWAEDSVGNVPRTPSGSVNYTSITFYVDELPPVMRPFGPLPQGRFVNATFDDDRTGIDRAVVWYRFNAETYQAMPLVPGDASVWSAVLPEGRKGDRLSYYLQAWDRVNNTDTFGTPEEPYYSNPVDNHAPTIRIVSPTDGGTLRLAQPIEWEASDADGDALQFTVYYRLAAETQLHELFRSESPETRRYTVNTASLADGDYVFQVTAHDGNVPASASVTVSIVNRASPFGTITPPPKEVDPAGTVLLQVEITKAAAQVEARLYRGDDLVDTYAMYDDGTHGDRVANDRVYSVLVTTHEPGDYRVVFASTYREDGVDKPPVTIDGGSFTTRLTPGYIVAQYGWAFVLLALLTLAVVAIAVFAIRSRR